MKHYKIIHKPSGKLMCYASAETDIKDIVDIFGDEYCAEDITKVEFEQVEK